MQDESSAVVSRPRDVRRFDGAEVGGMAANLGTSSQSDRLMDAQVVEVSDPTPAARRVDLPGRATVDGPEAPVLAGSEPEPAFTRPVRDP